MKIENKILKAIQKITKKRNLPLHEPVFFGNEKKYLNDCVDSTFVSSKGDYVKKFEKLLEKYTNVKNVILVNSGTSALHIALHAMNIKVEDEVILPSMTFVATANAIKYCNATPHFVDSEEGTLGMDPITLERWLKKIVIKKGNYSFNKYTNKRISAIVPMHTFGHPCKINELIKIAREYNLKLIEDAAESLGSFYNGKHVGGFGNIGILSFNGNKTITTGAGGAILTNNTKQANQIRHIISTAKLKHPYEYIHDNVGYNYRMPNLNASIGLAQLENINKIIKNKRNLYFLYKELFSNIDEIDLFKEPPNCKSNYWLQTIILKKQNKKLRNNILIHTNQKQIMTRPVWKLLHKLKPFKDCPKSPLPKAMSLENRIINIPSSYGLT